MRGIKKSKQIINEELKKENRHIIMIGEYTNMSTKTLFLCEVCNHEWNTTTCHIQLSRSGCPKCARNLPYTNETVDKILIDKKIPIKRLEDISKRNFLVKCFECHNIWKTTTEKLVRRFYGCKLCDIRSRILTNEEVDRRLIELKTNIIRLEDYIMGKVKIKFKCLICSHIWKTQPTAIFSGNRCPGCSQGKGEKRCGELIKLYIEYGLLKPQEPFYFNKRTYKVDFYLEIENKKVIIEYNGMQHYIPVTKFGGEEKFIIQKKRDKQLRRYCKKNNIYLLEIHYRWKENKVIEELEKINSFNLKFLNKHQLFL